MLVGFHNVFEPKDCGVNICHFFWHVTAGLLTIVHEMALSKLPLVFVALGTTAILQR
jgi:hypothetical protein